MKDVRARFQIWRSALEGKGLIVNISKTKIMVAVRKMQLHSAKSSLVEYAEKGLCLTQRVACCVIRECMEDASK